jgi:nicotinamide mononucleotide transporter
MCWLEAIAVLLALLGVIFTIQGKRICWILNVLSGLVYLKVFATSGLKGQMFLQLLYVGMGIYGYVSWNSEKIVEFKSLGFPKTFALTLFALSVGLVCFKLVSEVLLLDALITSVSVLAAFLVARRAVESWILWFCVDAVSIGMFCYQKLYLTAALFFVYALLSIAGYNEWSKKKVLST